MVMVDRSRFVYDNGYGTTTDIYLLPVGTKFIVKNGAWLGEIVEEAGVKMILANGTSPLEEDRDYGLTISISYKPEEEDHE